MPKTQTLSSLVKRAVVYTSLLFPVALSPACSYFSSSAPKIMDEKINYERDMIVEVNGVRRQGAITMPLLAVNKIHVYSQGDLDLFIMRTCGGVFKKQRAWNQQMEVETGLFGWGTKKIDLKNEVAFEIAASDFAATGVCPIYLTGISKTDGKNSEAFISWQTPEFQLKGSVVCNMIKRSFDGVEACSIATSSYTKVEFAEDVMVSPSPDCEIPVHSGRKFEFRVRSGSCNYRFESKDGKRVGVYNVYGWDSITIR